MRVIGLIQTRFNSTRLPGKALMDLNGMPVIQHIYRRLLGCRMVDEVAFAVGISEEEQRIGPVSTNWDVVPGKKWYVAPEKDLLKRIIWSALNEGAGAILRITGDCWAHDPKLLDNMILYFLDGYPHTQGVCNWNPRTYSEGVDAEIYTMELLNRLNGDPNCPREGFASYAVAHGLLSPWPIHPGDAYKDVHLSIDTQEDLDLARKILAKIGNNEFSYDKTMEAYHEVKG